MSIYNIGIDASFNSTGIIVLKEDDLHSSFNIIHKTIKKKKMQIERYKTVVIDKPPGYTSKDTEHLLHEYKTNPIIKNYNQITSYQNIIYETLNLICAVLIPDKDTLNIGIEYPIGKFQAHSIGAFSAACIAIQEIRMNYEIDIYEFTPTEIKKFITGKGNCKKEVIIKEVYKRYGFDTNINDIADAFAIAKLVKDRKEPVK